MVAEVNPASPHTDEFLELDRETMEDLKLFSDSGKEGSSADGNGGNSLFDYCDRCRSDGGRAALRRRMERPWASADRIRATQDTLQFISRHRGLFDDLPPEYTSINVARYSDAAMPIVHQQGPIEFSVAAFLFWFGDEKFYSKIVRGVELTHRFVSALQKISDGLCALDPPGELACLASQLRMLLEQPGIARVRNQEDSGWYWHKLRFDQTFRLHERAHLVSLLSLSYELDALTAMADVVATNKLVMPIIAEGSIGISAQALVHPLLPQATGNDVQLDRERRVLFLTGPNMAGKTTYMRAVVTAVYMAHLGMGVAAEQFTFVPVQRLLTSISLQDDLDDGISYFRAEALRVKAIAEAVGGGFRTLAVLDEPFKGTNVKDAFDASLAILQRFAAAQNCLFVVASHLIELREELQGTAGLAYGYFEANESGVRLSFDYVLHEGVSDQRLGMRVLREEGVFTLLDQGLSET